MDAHAGEQGGESGLKRRVENIVEGWK